MRNGTICSKHDDIYKLADEIMDLVSKCKTDGENMEQGLNDKRDRIKELEDEVERLQDELKEAQNKIADLENQFEEFAQEST